MSIFNQGQVVVLKSDKNVNGAIIEVIEGSPEAKYKVFTNTSGIQVYYESQLASQELQIALEEVDDSRFNAGLTAALIRNPTVSSLYSLNSAKIDFIPHQFRPVLKFIRSDRPRLLIADGVGVGKTIEAGLILRELEARRNLKSVLIICPRPLVAERKWEDEMKLRFGEEFTPLDGEKLRFCFREMDMEGDWPDKYKKCIIPYSLFDEASVFGSHNGKKSRMGLMEIDPPQFDLIIVDEAHHIRNTNTYAYRAVDRFSEAAEAAVFLTATPVQLEYDDLYVLLNLLRPDLIRDKNSFHEMAEPNEFVNKAAAIVRAQKDNWQTEAKSYIETACETNWGRRVFSNNPSVTHIFNLLNQQSITTEQRVQLISEIENLHTFSNIISRTRRRDIGEFTTRKPSTVPVDFTPAQRELYDEILSIIHDMLSHIHCTENTKFMMTTIRRQTASCLFGLVPMLNDILYRHVSELIDDEEFNNGIIDESISSEAVKARIERILKLAENLPPDDPKADALMDIIEKKQNEPKKKVMIFSSFKHTLRYLNKKLQAKGYRVGMVHGDVPDEERRDLRARFDPTFTPNESEDAIDIMLFSEVGCEGLDYQFCDCMINYDLPWNPMKVEQRIGRIDRNGQTSENVAIYNMITPDTVDADIYERCLLRIGVFHSSIGDCEDILGDVMLEIRRVVENFELTDEERREKLQQLMDNKVRYIKEKEELEEKQKDLFGLRVPDSGIDDEIKDATNFWLSGNNIRNLVENYLKEILEEDNDHILGDKELKTLRLSQAARSILKEEYRRFKFPKNEQNKTWGKWLDAGEQHLSVTFESNCWKNNPDVIFLSITHPLVKQAAAFLESKGKIATSLEVTTSDYPAGEYPFAIYQWKLSGEQEDLQIKPVSAEKKLNNILFELLKSSHGISYGNMPDLEYWEDVERVHHDIWEESLKQHKIHTEEIIRYKEASLKSSHAARMEQLQATLENSTDSRYKMLQEGKIRIAEEDFRSHMEALDKAKDKADILFELLAYGILIVKPA